MSSGGFLRSRGEHDLRGKGGIEMIDHIGLGPSSQTTNDQLELVFVSDTLSLDFFDINSYVIPTTGQRTWREVASEVLQEDADLWERLSAL